MRGNDGVIVCVAEAVQPAELLTVTVYVAGEPPDTGTVIDGVVCPPGDQRYVEMPVPLAVSVTLPPAHEFEGPLIETVGFGDTMTAVGADVAVQPVA